MSNLQIETGDVNPVDELNYEPVSEKFRSVQVVCAVIVYFLLAGLALLLLLVGTPLWCIVAEVAIAVSLMINLTILQKAYKFKGYALREHDITYRSGVIFPKTTTVPFSRIQQVSVSQNPVSKVFDLYAIDVVNGAQGLSSLVIQGLTKEKADGVKSVIIRRLSGNHD